MVPVRGPGRGHWRGPCHCHGHCHCHCLCHCCHAVLRDQTKAIRIIPWTDMREVAVFAISVHRLL